MGRQVSREQVIDVRRRARAFCDGVRAIGIGHEVERLAELDQPVHQQLGAELRYKPLWLEELVTLARELLNMNGDSGLKT